jgi:myo-inositol-1(or 4)-monophosphatase
MSSLEEMNEWEKFGIEVAIEGGKMMTAAVGKNKYVDTKSSMTDLVTETDRGVEAFLFGEIKKKYPTHQTIGEESSSVKKPWTDAPTWIIDPVDGTMNFVHTNPFCCVSIGVTYKKETVIGIVYNPFTQQLFTAKKGCGSFCNGKPISVRPCNGLSEALVVAELGSDRNPDRVHCVSENLKSVMWSCHGLRAMGSAAMNICFIASGFADAYWEFGLHIWDMVAADIILREAGGVTYDTKLGPLDLCSRRLIASGTEVVAQELGKALKVHLDLERDD